MKTVSFFVPEIKIQRKGCFQSHTVEKNSHVICRLWSAPIGKNCALDVKYGPRPAMRLQAVSQDLPGHQNT